MNLFSHIANAPSAKSPLADVASLGNVASRAEQSGLNQTDFSKYLQQLLAAQTPAKDLSTQRQDLAALKQHGANAPTERQAVEKHELMARDSRFESAKVKNSTNRAEQKSLDRQNQKETSYDNSTSRQTSDGNRRVVLKDIEQRTGPREETLETKAGDAASEESLPSSMDGTALKAINLSPQVQVITADNPATSDESLVVFARSMGMSDSTIQQLLGGQTPGMGLSNEKVMNLTLSDVSQSSGNNSTITAWPAGSILQNLMGRNGFNLPANPAADMTPSGMVTNATQLQGLQSMANESLDLINIQIGPMPSAIGSTQALTSMPSSTIAALSMLDTQFAPEAIAALQKEFEAPSSVAGEDHPGNGFGFTATGLKTGTAHTSAPLNAMGAMSQAAPMAETYEKLSEKLATELAARLHQQISDGQWKMKFALKPASLGAVDIQLEMRDGKLAALFQADNPLTQDLLQNGSQRLKDALHNLGMTQTSVQVGQGQAHSQGQGHTSSDTAKFGDNRGQTQEMDPNPPAATGHRRASDSQFDIYA